MPEDKKYPLVGVPQFSYFFLDFFVEASHGVRCYQQKTTPAGKVVPLIDSAQSNKVGSLKPGRIYDVYQADQ